MKDAFHMGQLVRITRPSMGSPDHRIYCIIRLIADKGEQLYRIKNTVGVERLVKADEIEPAALTAIP